MRLPRVGIAKKFKINALPLKTFARAERESAFPTLFEESVASLSPEAVGELGAPFTGYIKKGIYYYKTRGKGKAVNVNASHLNQLFSEHLKDFEFNKKHTPVLSEKINRILNEKLADYLHEQTLWKKRLSEIKTDIEKLEERFIKDELSKELFEKYTAKYKAEKKEIEDKLVAKEFNSSNLEKAVEKCLFACLQHQ
jgi:hypothetical protein